MMFHKVFQVFIVLTLGSGVFLVMAIDGESDLKQKPGSLAGKGPEQSVFAVPLPVVKGKEHKRTSTPPLTVHLHTQPINMTDEVNGSMEHLTLSVAITSLYIDREGSAGENGKSLLNEADQKCLAGVLKDSNVKELIFRGCEPFDFIEALEGILKGKGIQVSWKNS